MALMKQSNFGFYSLKIGMRRRMVSGQHRQFPTLTTRALGSRRFDARNTCVPVFLTF
jgi:hypothetical protein